jgi:hypothetical protein
MIQVDYEANLEISFVQILERIGFAPFVVLWYLLRGDKRHEKQTDALIAVAHNQALILQRQEEMSRRQDEFERRVWAMLTERIPHEIGPESSMARRLPLPPPAPPPLPPLSDPNLVAKGK